MTLYKLTSYPGSISLTEPEFRIAIQGGYDTLEITERLKNSSSIAHYTVKKADFMPGVVKAKMRMTKPCYGATSKPYWVVRF